MSVSFAQNSRPGPPKFLYAGIMNEGNATVSTVALTLGGTGAPLVREALVEDKADSRQLSLVDLLSSDPVNIERGLFNGPREY
jgi:hypothetical protein